MILNKFMNPILIPQKRYMRIYSCVFAGHSKWANIKHIKAQKDGQKSALFTKLARQIRLAVQDGGGNPELNGQLKNVIDEAVKKNMPMTTIKNSIKKSQQIKTDLKEYNLEIRFKQKVFVICILYTDNLAAIKMELAPILKKSGAHYVDVSHLFNEFGLIETKLKKNNLILTDLEEKAIKDAIECGAEDFEVADSARGTVNFICSPIELNSIRKTLSKRGYDIENAEHIYTAKSWVDLTSDEMNEYDAFLQKIKDVPGVENIFDNVNLT